MTKKEKLYEVGVLLRILADMTEDIIGVDDDYATSIDNTRAIDLIKHAVTVLEETMDGDS